MYLQSSNPLPTQENRRRWLNREYRVNEDGSINYKDVFRSRDRWYMKYTVSGTRYTTSNLWSQLEALMSGQMRAGICPPVIEMCNYTIELPDSVLVRNGTAVSMARVIAHLEGLPNGQPHATLYRQQRERVPGGSRIGRNLKEMADLDV